MFLLPTLVTLDFIIRISSTPTFLYFDLYLCTAYAAHYIYILIYLYGSPDNYCPTRHEIFPDKFFFLRFSAFRKINT